MEGEKTSKWTLLGEFFSRRFKEPMNHPEFIIYFISITIGVGAIDVWSILYLENHPVLNDTHLHLRISIMGYSLALISTGAVDLIFNSENIIKKVIQLIAFSSMMIGGAIFILCYLMTSNWGIFISIAWALISLTIWWIANGENANLTNYADDISESSKRLNDSLTQPGNGQ